MKQFIEVRGARQNNLKNVHVDIPRDKLTVLTGVSGSSKSSLAFEVIYGEGQRKFLESLSTFAKSHMNQLKKPDVDFIFGLSPVIAIQQKKGTVNPRSTVGTMTDTHDYMRLLFATCGEAECPLCAHPISIRTVAQMVEWVQSLPEGTLLEVRAPIFKNDGENYETLFDEIRTKGFRTIVINGEKRTMSDKLELDEDAGDWMEVVVDSIVVKPGVFREFTKTIENSLRLIGEGFIRFEIVGGEEVCVNKQQFYQGFCCPNHHLAMGELRANYFSFNVQDSACRTCGGLGTYVRAEPNFFVANMEKSLNKGAMDPRIFKGEMADTTWRWLFFYNMARHFEFSLDTSFRALTKKATDILFYGTHGERFELQPPQDKAHAAKFNGRSFGSMVSYNGMVGEINRWYKVYMKRGVRNPTEDEFFKRVMVEHTCPDCEGKKLKQQRFCVKIGGRDIHELCTMPIRELNDFLNQIRLTGDHVQAGQQIIHEVVTRVQLLIDIGLDYLNLNRRSDTLSGGEAQRIRLSTQISSGLMGMLYVLDEPSIGLHARDTMRIVNTLKRLRDIGNTIIVVEHDIDTIRNADHIIELGPGPGARGGHIVAEGGLLEVCCKKESLTGAYLSGACKIELPHKRREQSQAFLTIRGARANNLQNVDAVIPLGLFVCVTGVSGSGKSTLINEILYKQLRLIFHHARVVPGLHDALEGQEHISEVISIDQSPIGRSSRSNPATYVGIFDRIRDLFASSQAAVEKGLSKTDFSFNSKSSGRCAHCQGEGVVKTELQFMPDLETVCPVCKGVRFSIRVLEVCVHGKNIAQVLDMTIEEAIVFFYEHPSIVHKLNMLNALGLGYVKLGQSSNTLSGGEAQRIKLATELGKIKRGAHNLYILDEPTTGLHLHDVQNLIRCIERLVEAGHTVLVIEHHLDLIKMADYIIDMGPEGGNGGGKIMACGTPEQVAQIDASHTGRFLRKVLKANGGLTDSEV